MTYKCHYICISIAAIAVDNIMIVGFVPTSKIEYRPAYIPCYTALCCSYRNCMTLVQASCGLLAIAGLFVLYERMVYVVLLISHLLGTTILPVLQVLLCLLISSKKITLTVKWWPFIKYLMPAQRNPPRSKRHQISRSFYSIQWRSIIKVRNRCFYLFIVVC